MKLDSVIQYSSFICSLWVAGAALSAASAHADVTPANDNYCTNTCNFLIEPQTHQILNLKGIVGWTAEDDSQCASMAMPSSSTATPTLAQFQCMYHTGQLMQQCMAYDTAQQAGLMEEVMEGLDYGAAGVCALACFDPDVFSKVNMIQACDYTAMGVNALEIVDVFTEKSSIVGMAVESLMGVAGGIGSVASVAIDNGSTNASAKQSIQQTHDLACGTTALMTLEGTLRAFNFGEDNKTKQQACSVIVSLDSTNPTVGTGTTPTGTVQVGTVATTGSATSGGSSIASSVGTVVSSSSSTSSTTGSTSSSGTGTSTPTSTTVTNVPTAMTSCAQNGMGTQVGGCGLTADQLASPDATMLSGSLGPAAADYASRNPNLPSQLARGGSGVSDSSGNDLAPLAKLASAAISSASEFGAVGGTINSSSAPLVANNSSSSLSSTGEGSSFASRALASTSTSLPLPASQVTFSKEETTAAPSTVSASTPSTAKAAANPNDIWHAGYSGSIFDIVSTKMNSATSRVTYSEWLTPMNRGLAGLAPLSTVQSGAKQ